MNIDSNICKRCEFDKSTMLCKVCAKLYEHRQIMLDYAYALFKQADDSLDDKTKHRLTLTAWTAIELATSFPDRQIERTLREFTARIVMYDTELHNFDYALDKYKSRGDI